MFVIAVNGPPGSGKDTAADILVSLFNRNAITTKKFKFAHILKVGVHQSLGLAAAADYYELQKDVQLTDFFGLTPRLAYIKHSEEYMKKTYGDDVFAQLLIRQLDNQEKRGVRIAVISDCGFPVEVNKLIIKYKPENVQLIRMHREGKDFNGDSRGYVYSPNGVCTEWDLKNNHTILHLHDELEGYVAELFRKKNTRLVNF